MRLRVAIENTSIKSFPATISTMPTAGAMPLGTRGITPRWSLIFVAGSGYR